MSEDTTVAALFASAFADKGAFFASQIAENWSRDYLRNMDFSDQALLETFLREHPDDLPEVYLVTEKNVEKISKRSDAYRKSIIG